MNRFRTFCLRFLIGNYKNRTWRTRVIGRRENEEIGRRHNGNIIPRERYLFIDGASCYSELFLPMAGRSSMTPEQLNTYMLTFIGHPDDTTKISRYKTPLNEEFSKYAYDVYLKLNCIKPDGPGAWNQCCWLWTGNKKGRDRYRLSGSSISIRKGILLVCSESMMIPPNMIVVHRCNDESCVNPYHTELHYSPKFNYRELINVAKHLPGVTTLNNSSFLQISFLNKLSFTEAFKKADVEGGNNSTVKRSILITEMNPRLMEGDGHLYYLNNSGGKGLKKSAVWMFGKRTTALRAAFICVYGREYSRGLPVISRCNDPFCIDPLHASLPGQEPHDQRFHKVVELRPKYKRAAPPSSLDAVRAIIEDGQIND